MTSHTAAERRSISPLLILAGLAALVSLAYGGTLWNAFTFDDHAIVVNNPLIKRVEHWPTLLRSDYWAGTRDPAAAPTVHAGLYRPLVLLSFAFNHAVAGISPWSYHLVNVSVHLVVTWLVYLLARQLTFSPAAALIAAVLFALHPIHTEAVAGAVGRAELLMAACLLASLWAYARGRRWLSLAAFALALLSKEQALMLPILLVLHDMTVGRVRQSSADRRTGFRFILLRYGPYLLLLLGYAVLRGAVLGNLQPPPTPFLDNPLPHLEWWPRVLTTIKVAGQYLALCIWPEALSADYSYHAIPMNHSLLDGGVLFGVLAWGGLLTLAAMTYRKSPHVCFAVGFLVLTFLPVSNAVVPIGTIMGERLFYLPSVGFCLLLGTGYDAFIHWTLGRERKEMAPHLIRLLRNSVLAMFIVLCLALLLRTVVRIQDWMDDDHLSRSMLQVVPHSAKAHSIAGRLAKDKRQWNEAIEHFQEALRLYPDYPAVDPALNSNLGISLIESGRMAEGVEALERAVALDPRWSLPLYNLGFAYTKQGRNREAEAAYHEAVRLNDEDPKAFTGLGFLFLSERRYEEALSAAEAALQRDPAYIEAQYVKTQALQALGGNRAKQCPPGLMKC